MGMSQYNLLPKPYDTEKNLSAETSDGEKNTVLYKNGIKFDYKKGDFERDAKYRLIDSEGIESWASWCINCIQTNRYKHLAYSSNFGVDMDSVFEADSPEEAESVLIREITEALLADPYQRTAYISDIDIVWETPDSIKVYVIIQGVDDVTIDITAYLTKGG